MLTRRSDDVSRRRVERLLSDPDLVPRAQVPAGLRHRIMESVRSEEAECAPSPRLWPFVLAGTACLALAIGLAMIWRSPAPVGARGSARQDLGVVARLPLDSGGMIRLVADSLDRPLQEQADRIVSDTRRATRAIVGCIPFAGRGD